MKDRINLTKRQKSVLNFLIKYKDKFGYIPSIREICKGVKLSSSSSVHLHLKTLEKKGYIRRDHTKPRAIEILSKEEILPKNDKVIEEKKETKKISSLVECPLLRGYIEGQPLDIPQNVEKILPLPIEIIGRKDAFLLRMTNNSMIGAGILEGDLCILHPLTNFEDGKIMAIYSRGTLTIKRIYKTLRAYRLEPENRKMNPVFVKDIKVIGIIKGIIRLVQL